jgi:hypothetical protein
MSALPHNDPTSDPPVGLTEEEIEGRLGERPDLLARFAGGDTLALAELFEVGTGSMVTSVEVRTQ